MKIQRSSTKTWLGGPSKIFLKTPVGVPYQKKKLGGWVPDPSAPQVFEAVGIKKDKADAMFQAADADQDGLLTVESQGQGGLSSARPPCSSLF